MSGKGLLVKAHLKPSFIDPAADLHHIRVRRGPDVAFRNAISRTGEDGAGLWSFFKTPDKENFMIRKTTYKDNLNRLRHAVCAFGLLISLATLPASAQHVHQLSYTGAWTDTNPVGATTDSKTGVAAFLTTPNNQVHTFYLASDDSVHQLFYNGVSWSDENLTSATGAPLALAKSPVSGFSIDNFQYVYYIGSDHHLHQLLYNNVKFADTDLTKTAGGPLARTTTKLVAFTTGSPAAHVYYQSANGHIHQTYTVERSTWQDQDLTAIAKGTPARGVWMAGFNTGNFQYVYFVATTGHVHQLFYNNSTWTEKDLTALSGSEAVASGSGVSAFVIAGGTDQFEVYFVGTDKHIVELSSTNNQTWAFADLTDLTGAPVPAIANQIVAFPTPNDDFHVYFVAKSHIHQLYLPINSLWQIEDLTVESKGPNANGISGMAGYASQNNQYVYYVAK